MIDLEPEYLAEIKEILLKHTPNCEVRAFGSRTQGKAKRFSDLDLVVIGKQELDEAALDNLKDALSQSDLPIMVDIVDWFRISDRFRAIIERQYDVIHQGR